MQLQPLWLRVICNLARAFLALIALLVALIAGGVVVLPLAIFAPPLVAIIGGLLVLVVFAATGSMAEDWQAARMRRRDARPVPPRLAQAQVRRPPPATGGSPVPSETPRLAWPTAGDLHGNSARDDRHPGSASTNRPAGVAATNAAHAVQPAAHIEMNNPSSPTRR
jgi:hypothetical protein